MRFNQLSRKVESVDSDVDNLLERGFHLKHEAENVWPFDFKGYEINDALKAINRDLGTTNVTAGYVTTEIDKMIAANHRITPPQASELEGDRSSIIKNMNTLKTTCDSARTALLNNNLWASLQDIWEQFVNGVSRVSMQVLNWGIKNLVAPLLPGGSNQNLLTSISSWWQSLY
jgi:hypothetical protein